LLGARNAAADWPVARHDPRRTGTATGTSNITIPVAFWRYYLGGFIRATNLRTFDVDSDGVGEVVVVTGGRAIAKEISDETRWETSPLELTTMDGFADLDGDGTVELIAHSRGQVYVVSPTDGAVLWQEPPGEMGTIAGVRIGDITGDGVDDLVIGECGCCNVNSGNPGFAYSFAGDIASPSKLWAFPVSSCGGSSGALALANVDGNPGMEVVLGENDHLSLIDGSTGTVIAASPLLGTKIQRSQCTGANVDGAPGDELICLMSVSDPPATDQRRAFALRYVSGPSHALALLWSTPLAPDGGELEWVDPVADLDADGRPEVVASGKALDGTWTTTILAGESGAVVATIPDSIVRGVARALPGGETILFTALDTSVTAWTVSRTATPPVAQLWTIPNADLLLDQEPTAIARSALDTHVLTADIDGNGRADILTRSLTGPAVVTAYAATTTSATSIGQFPLPADRKFVRAWATGAGQRLGVVAVLEDDGLVRILDEGLVPIASSDDVVAPGLRFGGYYLTGGWRALESTMVAGPLAAGGPDAIVARDSSGSLVRLNAAMASFASPPRAMWERKNAFSPAIVRNLAEGQPGVACFSYAQPVLADPDYVLSALTPTGTPIWSVGVPKRPINDILPGRFDGDAVPDLVFEWGDPGDTLSRKRAVSGATGATIWNSMAIEAGAGRQPAGLAAGPWDADGLDDVYTQTRGTRVLSGADGSELTNSGGGPPYFQPILANLDGDPRNEVTLQGGFAPARVLDDNLASVLWQSAEDDRPFPYGAMVTCPDGTKGLVEGSQRNPARLKVTTLSGTDFGTQATVVLAGGQAYADEPQALADGQGLSQLGSVAAHTNLRGTGEPVAMVGSGDGWLYGYQPCTGTLGFVYRVGSPVGSPIFADTDGDGKDEILVSAADGYLYALGDLAIAAPGYVWDTDPDHGITDRDVNSIATDDHLSARWRDVPGAVSYEVTAVTLDGDYISDPPWTDVGNVVEATVTGLPLENGVSYRFAVRAIGAQGRSVDTVSDGVVVRLPSVTDAGLGDAGPESTPSGGCGCRAGADARDMIGLLLLLLALVSALKRRAR